VDSVWRRRLCLEALSGKKKNNKKKPKKIRRKKKKELGQARQELGAFSNQEL
jgi:hypothetical protein